MNYKIGNYIESKMKKNHITKVKLHEQIKDSFHLGDDYVSYKGFATRFYTKFYAEDLFEISYLLGIDLNKMRDEMINAKKNNSEVTDILLEKSRYIQTHSGEYSKWFEVEDDLIYVIWFKQADVNSIDYVIEMYDMNTDEIFDITFLTYNAVIGMEEGLNNKSLGEKLKAIKSCNKEVYDKLKIKISYF